MITNLLLGGRGGGRGGYGGGRGGGGGGGKLSILVCELH
jgi:hypothetical protein